MPAASAAAAGTPADHDRWYEKDPGAPADRFPVLVETLAEVAKAWTDGFAALAASPGEIEFAGLRAAAAEEFAALDDPETVLVTIRAAGWDTPAGLVVARPFLSLTIDALFGGEGGGSAGGRPISPVEWRIVDVLGGQAAAALTAGFRAVAPTRFAFERAIRKRDPLAFGKPGTPLLAARFELRVVGQSATIEVLLPTHPVAGNQAWGAPATAPVVDEVRWTERLHAELARASVVLSANVAAGPLSLGDIAHWRVGDLIELPPAAASNVALTCQNQTLFQCDLGQSAGRYTVRLGERLLADPPSPHKGA